MKSGRFAKAVKSILVIAVGCGVFAIGFDLFLEPHQINIGGVSGLAMVIRELTGFGTVGMYTFLINVPLFLIGFRLLGKEFFFGSLIGMTFSSLLVDVLTCIPVPQTDTILASLYGGILTGFGLGLVFTTGASTGGSDILARLLKKRFREAGLGKLMLALDIFVITLTGIVYHDISKALYSALPLVISSAVIDAVMYNLDYSVVALVVTDRYSEVAEKIGRDLERGVTFLDGQGSYTGEAKKVILSAIRKKQTAELKKLVQETDENAFLILQPAHQVLGEGFKRYSDDL